MTDIVERLNEPCPCSYCDGDAANQRDEAKAEIERLREALRPFVEPCIEHCHETCESEEERMEDCPCFKARAALEEKE